MKPGQRALDGNNVFEIASRLRASSKKLGLKQASLVVMDTIIGENIVGSIDDHHYQIVKKWSVG